MYNVIVSQVKKKKANHDALFYFNEDITIPLIFVLNTYESNPR